MINMQTYATKHLRLLLMTLLAVLLCAGLTKGSGTDVNFVLEVIGEGTTVPPEGYSIFYMGNNVQLTATPADGWYFNRWITVIEDETYVSDSPSDSFYLSTQSDIMVTAVFTSYEDYTPVSEILLPYGDVTITVGESVNFQGTASDGNPPYTYLWDFDGGVPDSTEEDPGSQVFNKSGVYLVTFTAFDDDGDPCAATVTITVEDENDGGDGDGGGGGGGGGCFINTILFKDLEPDLSE